MQYVTTILWQIVTMFILVAVGWMMFRYKKISQEGSKALGNILIFLSLPCVIINSFLVERTPERTQGLLISAILAFAALLLSTVISRLLLGRNAIEVFAGSYSNPGFFGIPLITASLAEGSVFYVAAFIAFLNLFQWTYGVSLLQQSDEYGMLPAGRNRGGDGKRSDGSETNVTGSGKAAGTGRNAGAAGRPFGEKAADMGKKLIKAPFMIAIIIGCFFFFTQISMPAVIGKCVTFIANLNTPIAMFTVGIYLAQTDVPAMFRKPRLYLVSAVRMLIVPLVTMLVLCPVPGEMLQMKLAILIAAACPVGSNVAVYAQLNNSDYSYAVETVVISTMLSIITIPAVIAVAGMLWM